MTLALRSVLHPRDGVAQRRDGESHHWSANRGVCDLIEPAFAESAIERDMSSIGNRRVALHAREPPSVARNRLRLAVGLIADEHDGALLLEIGRRVGQMTAVGEKEMR